MGIRFAALVAGLVVAVSVVSPASAGSGGRPLSTMLTGAKLPGGSLHAGPGVVPAVVPN
jgi:hypothetical protein